MNNIFEAMRNLVNNKTLLEMVKIDKRDYKKLPLSIWVDEAGNKRNTKYGYECVKIVNNYNDNNKDLIPVYYDNGKLNIKKKWKLNVSETDINKCLKFIEKNLNIFEKRWLDEITTNEMFEELNKNNERRDK